MNPRNASSSQIAGSTAISTNGSQGYGADAIMRSIDCVSACDAVLQRVQFVNRDAPAADPSGCSSDGERHGGDAGRELRRPIEQQRLRARAR